MYDRYIAFNKEMDRYAMTQQITNLKADIKLDKFTAECSKPVEQTSEAIIDLDLELPEGLFGTSTDICATTAARLFKQTIEHAALQVTNKKLEKQSKKNRRNRWSNRSKP